MISAAIFTLDEEINLPHCLRSLSGLCDDVVVIDSFSSDQTCSVAQAGGARVFQNKFTGFGDQRMWAFQNIKFKHPWVLVLDADERVTPEFWSEMQAKIASAADRVGAFRLKRRFYWEGEWLRHANLYPSWVVRLVRPGRVAYMNRGHAETQEVQGEIGMLHEDLIDENHKGFDEWKSRQLKYAEQEAAYELKANSGFAWRDLFCRDPLKKRSAVKYVGRHLPFRGLSYFIYSWVFCQGWRDGAAGFRFCLEKARIQSEIRRLSRKLRRP